MYFKSEDDEYCYTRELLIDEMKDDGISEMKVFEAIPDTSKEYFFCKSANETSLSEEYPCGKTCEDYEPRNGKSGMCKYKTRCYTWGKEVIIKCKNQER